MVSVKETKEGTIIKVYVKPKSKRFSIKFENNEIIVHCTEPPIKGRANREIEKKLSKIFKVKTIILSGHSSQHKYILIQGLSFEKVKHVLSNFESKGRTVSS